MAVQKTETFIPSVKFNKLTKEQYDQAVLNGEIQPTEFYLVEELNDNFGDMMKKIYDPQNKFTDIFASIPNPNLLDNSNFEINQRGNTSYISNSDGTDNGIYCVDRWKIYNSVFDASNKSLSRIDPLDEQEPVIPDDSDGFIAHSNKGQIYQLVPLAEKGLSAGDTVTVSLYVDGVLYSGSGEVVIDYPNYNTVIDEDSFSVYLSSQDGSPSTMAVVIQNNKEYPSSIKIEKVKLEKGSTATPWQPKGYGAELSECMRYYQNIAFSVGKDRSTYKYTPTLVPMRISPTYRIQQITASGTLPTITTAPLYFTASLADSQYYDGIAYLSADL